MPTPTKTLTATAALLLAAHAATAALLPVAEYSMADGYNNGWYNDNGYTGTKVNGYLSGGTGQLTNGSKGNPILTGYAYSEPYLFWQNFNPEILFDLGATAQIQSIRTYFLIHNASATYLPDHVDLSFSTDGLTWSPALTRTFTPDEKNPGGAANIETSYELLPTPQSARYAKLTYVRTNGHQWMAFDEVEFAGLIPEPASLSLLTLMTLPVLRRRR